MKDYSKLPKVVVAFTSHGERLQLIPRMLDRIIRQTVKPWKVVMTLTQEDYSNLCDIPFDGWIVEGRLFSRIGGALSVEILIAEQNLGPHLKYFYAMSKYRNEIIITVDDDRLYHDDLIESLLVHHIKHPGCVTARRCVLIRYDNGGPVPFIQWPLIKDCDLESLNLLAEGFSGCLYPPDILHINRGDIKDIKRCLWADDIYLRWKEKKLGVKVVRTQSDYFRGGEQMCSPIVEKTALSMVNTCKGRNDQYVQELGFYE